MNMPFLSTLLHYDKTQKNLAHALSHRIVHIDKIRIDLKLLDTAHERGEQTTVHAHGHTWTLWTRVTTDYIRTTHMGKQATESN